MRGRNLIMLAGIGAGALIAARSALRVKRRMEFRDKVVLITGGSRGLGLVLARRFALEGADLVICSRGQDELDRAKSELDSLGVNVLAVRCDITKRDQVEHLVRQAVEHFGGIDVLVNNAGVIVVGPMEMMTLEDFQEQMDVHYWGPLNLILDVLPSMRARGGGRIVNITSIGGKLAFPHLLPYTASKFALAGLSEGLREELRKDNILVTTVCPGLMRTGSPRNANFKSRHRAEYAWFSVSDSMPGLSQSAEQAADRIINACRYGEAELITSLPASIAIKLYSLFPGISQDIYTLLNRMLPKPGGVGPERRKGYESESFVTQSPATLLTQRAARRNNEVPA